MTTKRQATFTNLTNFEWFAFELIIINVVHLLILALTF